jgi:hypothetical protein
MVNIPLNSKFLKKTGQKKKTTCDGRLFQHAAEAIA